MPYCSSRDISGLFLLDIDKANIAKKSFIKIHLYRTVDFADSISYSDYNEFKNEVYNRNRWRDVYMDFFECRAISGFHCHEMVLIRDKEPACINPWMFGVLIFLMFGQIYKSYVNSFV